MQGAYIQTQSTSKRKQAVIFESEAGKSGPLKSMTSGDPTFPLSTSNNDTTVNLSFFYTEDKNVGKTQLIAPTYASSKLDIQMVGLQD